MATLLFGLAQQAVADHPALHLVAFAAGQRAVVDREGHREGRRVDRLGGSGRGHRQVARVSATVALARPAMATMSPASASRPAALEAAEGEHLGDAAASISLPSTSARWIGGSTSSLPLSIRPVRRRPEERVAVEQSREHRERLVGARPPGARHVVDDHLEQRRQVAGADLVQVAPA